MKFDFMLRIAGLALCALMAGCLAGNPKEVVVYAALDKEFSEPILNEFGKKTGIQVLSKFDIESNKTVGLANEIIAHAKRPRGDLFWNNEILHTIRLEKLGLLEVYRSPEAVHFPSQFVSTTGHWHGFAARARVLIVNKELLPDPTTWPDSILDLAQPAWKGKCCTAKPLFGTSATHAAVLFATWPTEQSQQYFRDVQSNARIEGGNKKVAENVGQGVCAFGLTDTDDAIIEVEQGRPVAIVFPDQKPEQIGSLLIPNTLGILKGGPNPAQARQIVDFLLSASTEERLAACPSAQIPLGQEAKSKSRVAPDNLKVMTVDFSAAAEKWEDAQKFLQELFR